MPEKENATDFEMVPEIHSAGDRGLSEIAWREIGPPFAAGYPPVA